MFEQKTDTDKLTESRRGAWLINIAKHLAMKVSSHPALSEIENLQFAGKCGSLLIALAAEEEQEQLNGERVQAIARHCGIDKYTLKIYLKVLKQYGCVDYNDDDDFETVEVLAFTRHRVLETTARICTGSVGVSTVERAIPELLEYCLIRPRITAECKSLLVKDLSENDANSVLRICEDLELLGVTSIGDSASKLYFNGYQFGDKSKDFGNALASIAKDKRAELDELLGLVSSQPAVLVENLSISEPVIKMALAFGLIEESDVSSTAGVAKFLTLPRFAAPSVGEDEGVMELDVFHHAKELLAALRFGELKSHAGRGKLNSPRALINALIDRDQVGPATAIGQDYGSVEASGVIRTVKATDRYGDQRYMQLRRKEPAMLLRKVLEASPEEIVIEKNLSNLAFPTRYQGPEIHRLNTLKTMNKETLAQFMAKLRG